MTAQVEKTEAGRSEELSRAAEIRLEQDDSRKDLKEKRGVMKETLYDGSKKLKHVLPKGKHI